MPSPPEDEQPIAEQLAALFAEPGAPSQRELASRLALEVVGRDDAAFASKHRSKMRWIQKVLYPDQDGGVLRPSDASLDAIERAFGRPGYFKRPVRPSRQARAAARESVERRLEEVAAQATRDAIQIRQDLNAAIRRIRALEKRAAGGDQPASEEAR